MTNERLKLPSNMIATLSPKRTLAHSGIIVLGGFAIDPNYSGVLWMGLYNFSSTKFPLRAGRKLIAAMFYELYEGEAADFPTPAAIAADDDFPGELVSLIKNYKPVELKGLQDEIEETKRQMVQLRAELTSDRDWRTEFKDGLEKHNHQLGQLIEGLKEERDTRREEDNQIRTRLDSISGVFVGMRIIWVILALIIGAALQWAVPKAFEWTQHSSGMNAPLTTVPPASPLPIPVPQGTPERK
jgi:hypothetical protein